MNRYRFTRNPKRSLGTTLNKVKALLRAMDVRLLIMICYFLAASPCGQSQRSH